MHTTDNSHPTSIRERTQRSDPKRQADSRALWRMTAQERARAMWAGELTYRQLCEWSSQRPDEVPLIGGEFAWIVGKTPEWAEAGETATVDRERAA
jgi:hypothetical protein